MTTLTDPQRKVLFAVLKDDGNAVFASKGSPAVLRRVVSMKLVDWAMDRKCGRDLTSNGVKALHDWYRARWHKHGCQAYLMDLNEVEALIRARG